MLKYSIRLLYSINRSITKNMIIALKYLTFVATLATTFVAVLAVVYPDQAALRPGSESEDKYLIELGPGDTRWVVEGDKWDLRRVCILFNRLKLPFTPCRILDITSVSRRLKMLTLHRKASISST